MKAAIYTKYGPPEVLKISEVDKPICKDNEILVKMHATTVNSADVRIRKADPFLARLAFGLLKPKKTILGTVVSGEVVAIGKNVTKFKEGDKVFGLNDLSLGCYGQYVAILETTPLAIIPTELNFSQSASLVFGGHTALHFLRSAKITKGQKILIYGASGAVGLAAVQIAKFYEAEVTAVTSEENIELVKKYGADFAIDYKQERVSDLVKKYEGYFDIVYETVDKSSVFEIAKLVKSKSGILMLGAVIIKGALQGLWAAKKHKIKLIAGVAKVTSEDMEFIAKLGKDKKLAGHVDKIYRLDQIVEAHRYVDLGHKKGNVIIEID